MAVYVSSKVQTPLEHEKVLLCVVFFFKILLIYFREGRREEERGGEKHQCVVAFCTPPTGDLFRNPGMCPDWESNQQPFGL